MALRGPQHRRVPFRCSYTQKSACLQACSALTLVSFAQSDLHVKFGWVLGSEIAFSECQELPVPPWGLEIQLWFLCLLFVLLMEPQH